MAFKVEYKSQANQQWQTKLSGADETSAFSTYERLKININLLDFWIKMEM